MTVAFGLQVPAMPEGWRPGDPIPMDISMSGPPTRQPVGPGLEGETAFLKQQPSSSEDSEDAPEDDSDGALVDASFLWQHWSCSKQSLGMVLLSLASVCDCQLCIQSDQGRNGWPSRPALRSLPSLTACSLELVMYVADLP